MSDTIGFLLLSQCNHNLYYFFSFQGEEINVHPWYLMLPAAISCSFAFMLPVATPPNAIVFSGGHLKVKDMVCIDFCKISSGLIRKEINTVEPLHNGPLGCRGTKRRCREVAFIGRWRCNMTPVSRGEYDIFI